MSETQYEAQITPVREQETSDLRLDSYPVLTQEHFAIYPTESLTDLWKWQRSRKSRKANELILEYRKKIEAKYPNYFEKFGGQVFKGVSLELFFRLNGDDCRYDYNKWLDIKKRKRQDWEQQMHAKYGDSWEHSITASDRKLLTYTEDELDVRARHEAIEAEAMGIKKKDIKKLQKKEKKERKEQMNFFKLVTAKTLEQNQFLGEREVHKAVYSSDFLFFYMNQLIKGMISQGIRHLRGKQQHTAYQELERMVLAGANYVKKLVIKKREQNVRRPVSKVALS